MLLFFKGVDYLRAKKDSLTDLPDPDNLAQLTRFYHKFAEVLNEPEWPEEIAKAAEYLLERVEASPEVLETYFKDCWLSALQRAEADLLQVFLDISCVNPASQALQPQNEVANFCFNLLKSDAQPHLKLAALKLIGAMPRSEAALLAVIECLKDQTDFLRTETLAYLKTAAEEGEGLHRVMCSLGILDELMGLLCQEEDYTVKESLGLLKALMSPYTRQVIREVPGLPPALSNLLNRFTDEVLAFLHAALKDDHQEVIPSNQLFFSPLMPAVAALALPVTNSEVPNTQAQSLLHLLITHNKLLLKKALNLQLGSFDFIEVAACHALSFIESRAFLSKLIQESQDVQPAIVNKFTAIPGFEVTQGSIRPLNWLLLDSLGSANKCISLCEMLEMLVYDNALSKELAQNLPIDFKSSTLRSQLTDMFIRELHFPNSPLVIPLARLFLVWTDAGFAAKIFDKVVSVLPQILTYTQQNSDLGFLSAMLGSLALQRPDEAAIFKSSISLQSWLKSLDTLTREKALDALAIKADLVGSVGVITSCFAKEFSRDYPRMRKQLLALYADEADNVLKELVEVSQAGPEVGSLQKRLAEAQFEIEKTKTALASVRLECAAKVRGLMEALIEAEWKAEASQEQIWRLERDNTQLKQRTHGSPEASPADAYLEKRLAQAEEKNSELLELVGVLTSQSSACTGKDESLRILTCETTSFEVVGRTKKKVLSLCRLSNFHHVPGEKSVLSKASQTTLAVTPPPAVQPKADPKETPLKIEQKAPLADDSAGRDLDKSKEVRSIPPPKKNDVAIARPKFTAPPALTSPFVIKPPAGKLDTQPPAVETAEVLESEALKIGSPSPIEKQAFRADPFTSKKTEKASRPKVTAPPTVTSPFASIVQPSQKTAELAKIEVPLTDSEVLPITPVVDPLTSKYHHEASAKVKPNTFASALPKPKSDPFAPQPKAEAPLEMISVSLEEKPQAAELPRARKLKGNPFATTEPAFVEVTSKPEFVSASTDISGKESVSPKSTPPANQAQSTASRVTAPLTQVNEEAQSVKLEPPKPRAVKNTANPFFAPEEAGDAYSFFDTLR